MKVSSKWDDKNFLIFMTRTDYWKTVYSSFSAIELLQMIFDRMHGFSAWRVMGQRPIMYFHAKVNHQGQWWFIGVNQSFLIIVRSILLLYEDRLSYKTKSEIPYNYRNAHIAVLTISLLRTTHTYIIGHYNPLVRIRA